MMKSPRTLSAALAACAAPRLTTPSASRLPMPRLKAVAAFWSASARRSGKS
jgi:hypothetical protein